MSYVKVFRVINLNFYFVFFLVLLTFNSIDFYLQSNLVIILGIVGRLDSKTGPTISICVNYFEICFTDKVSLTTTCSTGITLNL